MSVSPNNDAMNYYSDKEVYAYFDSDECKIYEQTQTLVMEQLLSVFTPQNNASEPLKTVVDLGCGTGNMLQKLGQKFHFTESYGLDLSSQMLEIAKEKIPDLITICDSAFHVNEHLPREKADLLFVHFLFAYLEHKKLIKKASDVIKPGGLLSICSTMVGSSFEDARKMTSNRFAQWIKWLFQMDVADIQKHYAELMPESIEQLTQTLQDEGYHILQSKLFRVKVTIKTWRDGWNFMYKSGWLVDIFKRYNITKFKGICLFYLWKAMNWLKGDTKDLTYEITIAVLLAKKMNRINAS